jgi:hypothetical protein
MFNSMADTKITHVPCNGSNPALLDLMAGTIQVAFATVATAAPLVQTRRLKARRRRGETLGALSGIADRVRSGIARFRSERMVCSARTGKHA